MGERVARSALFDGFAEVAKALASGRRAELVDVLAQGERSVEELSEEIGQNVANTSHHLRAIGSAPASTTGITFARQPHVTPWGVGSACSQSPRGSACIPGGRCVGPITNGGLPGESRGITYTYGGKRMKGGVRGRNGR